jgi:hypothetical protein
MSARVRIAIGLLALAALGATGIALVRTGVYGWTIFVAYPVLLGGLGAWTFPAGTGRHAARRGMLTVMAATCLLFCLGLEGAICIVMSWPLALPLGALGGWLVHRFSSSPFAARGLTMLLLLPPVGLTYDIAARPPLFAVRTTIEISASPEQVWKHVVSFPDLPESREWYFRTGLAYPQRARIEGLGRGAVRYCDFSTGSFVEPIDIWDEPRLLRFRVTENPAPMREWSPYSHVEPKHLHGYLVSRQGQFRLTAIGSRGTLLEGTTWYQHGLWPAQYWRWWSDAIIHRIHLRVLNHIRDLAERDARLEGKW